MNRYTTDLEDFLLGAGLGLLFVAMFIIALCIGYG